MGHTYHPGKGLECPRMGYFERRHDAVMHHVTFIAHGTHHERLHAGLSQQVISAAPVTLHRDEATPGQLPAKEAVKPKA